MPDQSNDETFELMLQRDAAQIRRRCDHELDDQLAGPDFCDLACRVRRLDPTYWSPALLLELQEVPPMLLEGCEFFEELDQSEQSRIEFDSEFARIFSNLAPLAEAEAAQMIEPVPAPTDLRKDTERRWWKRLAMWLGLGAPGIGWGPWRR